MIQVLVTGSSGQLGKSIRKLSRNYPECSFHFRSKEEFDICDINAIEKHFNTIQFNYCINCAAYTDVEGAESNPDMALAVNAEGVANLAEVCKANNVVLIHISTDYVFDGKNCDGYKPDDQPNPINEYGRSKWEGEKHIQQILDQYYIVRTSWLYSYTGSNFYTKIIKAAKENPSISVTNEQYGCPTHADSLAKYLIELIANSDSSFGIHHFTDGEAMTWYDFAQRILSQNELLQYTELIASPAYPTVAKRPACSILLP